MTEMMFRKKVLACWFGKNIGGTLGGPYEGFPECNDLTFYDPVPCGSMPNDDLELQAMYAAALARMEKPEINREILADIWLEHMNFHCDEYAVAMRNLALGIRPPWSGSYDNYYVNGMGAAIRSELWACLAPGDPALAARFAYEDACIDHAGDGIDAEVFFAVVESLAFVEADIRTIIDAGLASLPPDSVLAEGIRMACSLWDSTGDWRAVRDALFRRYATEFKTDVRINIPFTVLALLSGEGDFGKTICLAVNCGQDADCTGATVGAIFGIINPDLISEEWLKPIGHSLVVSKEINGIQPPATLEAFTELVAGLRNRVTLKDAPETEFDLKPFAIPARRSVFHPWFAGDFRKFNPALSDNAETVLLPGNLTTIDFSALPGESLLMLETEFRVEADRVVRLLVNTPANMQVWVDGVFRFGRECGGMVPAFHRAMQNQLAEFELKAGLHKLLIGLAPATPEMKHADLLFGIADTKNHWLPNAFR